MRTWHSGVYWLHGIQHLGSAGWHWRHCGHAKQCINPRAGDKNLVTWQKAEVPLIAVPPSSMPLVGWRDPFIFEVGGSSEGGRWGMLMGSGLKGKGGAVMIYRADSLLGGEYS